MDRRFLIGSLIFGALAVPRAASAQPGRKMFRIGILNPGMTSSMVGPQPRGHFTGALLRGLRQLGYVYGEHFVTEPRGAEGRPERYPALAAELVRLQVDLIVLAGHTPATAAAKEATSTIPIVMAGAEDPVGQGLVESLGHPGRNFTGLSLQAVETTGKRLELLKELVSDASPVVVLRDQRSLPFWQAAEAAARTRGWKLLSLEIRNPGEIEGAFKTAIAARAGALLVISGALFEEQAQRIAKLAAGARLPTMYGLRFYVEAGGLISYSADLIEIWRRAAVFVDKILKGAKPADLPVEQPTKFELIINLKTAKVLGLTIPQTLLLRADQVIE
jgi:putative tryptophan/tyrosine transport system substrate-binding protein